MNYQSLIYFKTVAELQHYTRASEALYITQPALSKAIRNLEMELGANLFKKDGRNVVLTQYGHLFYEYVKRSVDEINKGVTAVRHLVDVECNTIFLSCLFSMYAIYLPDKIFHFCQQNPSCRFSLEYKFTTAIVQDVIDGRCELGICGEYDTEDTAYLNTQLIYREPISLIVSKKHPFANREKVSVSDLRDERFIVYFKSKRGTNKLLYNLCAPYGFEPNVVAEAYNDYGILGKVAAGDGIAIVANSGALNLDNVVPVHLGDGFPTSRNIYLVWRKNQDLPPMVTAFRDLLIQSSRKPPQGTFPTSNP